MTTHPLQGTRTCRYWKAGTCRNSECTFAHGEPRKIPLDEYMQRSSHDDNNQGSGRGTRRNRKNTGASSTSNPQPTTTSRSRDDQSSTATSQHRQSKVDSHSNPSSTKHKDRRGTTTAPTPAYPSQTTSNSRGIDERSSWRNRNPSASTKPPLRVPTSRTTATSEDDENSSITSSSDTDDQSQGFRKKETRPKTPPAPAPKTKAKNVPNVPQLDNIRIRDPPDFGILRDDTPKDKQVTIREIAALLRSFRKSGDSFAIIGVLAAVLSSRKSLTPSDVASLIEKVPPDLIEKPLTELYLEIPLLFYAIYANNSSMVQLCLQRGADPNIRGTFYNQGSTIKLPPLLFAILHDGRKPWESSTEIVKYLLAYGADPSSVDSEFVNPIIPPEKKRIVNTQWFDDVPNQYHPFLSQRLHEELTLAIRYYIHRATFNFPPPTPRLLNLLDVHRIRELLRAPYFMIGQELATKRVIDGLIFHHERPNPQKGVVFCFAGPSGHGKTFFANNMGAFLNYPFLALSMNEIHTPFELFGSPTGYHGNDTGSPLSNFLVQNKHKRVVVLLDEFEKVHEKIREALLTIWEDGRFKDRRTNEYMQTDIIWILATNAVDEQIKFWFSRNEERLEKPLTVEKQYNQFRLGELRGSLIAKWGAAVVSRIQGIVPFLPFLPIQATAAVAEAIEHTRHSYAVEKSTLLKVQGEDAVASTLSTSYNRDLGHRSIKGAVDLMIEEELVRLSLSELDVPVPVEGVETRGMEEFVALEENGMVEVKRLKN